MNVVSMCAACISVVSLFVFFFKQKTAYEMRISDWSSDVCSSDLCFPINVGGASASGPRRIVCWRCRGESGDWNAALMPCRITHGRLVADRKSVGEGQSVSVRVDLGGHSIIKKTHQTK